MKSILASLFLVLLFQICLGQSDNNLVVIKGTMNGNLKGHYGIQLFNRLEKDSTLIKGGHYSFTFPFTGPTFKAIYPEYIQAMGQMYQPFGILISEPGIYYVTSDIDKGLFTSSEVKGPKSAELNRRFELDQSRTLGEISRVISDLYGKQWYMISENDPKYEKLQSTRDSLNNLMLVPLIENLIKKHPDSYASAFVLAGAGKNISSLDKKNQLLYMLSPDMQESEAGKNFADYLRGLKGSAIGSKVADFMLPDPVGKSIAFKEFSNKYVLLDFWASWCAPCRKSFPYMREVYKKYANQPFEIFSISIDESKPDWLQAVKEENNPWPQVWDNEKLSNRLFAVTSIPATFLIDREGKIIAKEVGFDPKGEDSISQKLKELFGK